MKEPDAGCNFDDSGYCGQRVAAAVPPISRVEIVKHVPQSDLRVDDVVTSSNSGYGSKEAVCKSGVGAPAIESSSALERGGGCGGGKVRGEEGEGDL